MGKNLVLLGMMGVGKTSLAKALASKYKLQFVDTDALIEKKNSMTIEKIFKNMGENFFREEEEKIVINALDEKNSVIALGGGAFINEKIRKKVLASSVSFWLDIKIETLEKRLENSKKRPLLNKNEDIIKKKIEKIYKDRKSIYSLANYKINCDKLSLEEISKEVMNLYVNR